MMARATTVVVVDDSAFSRAALCRLLATDPELRVVGTAENGEEAVDIVAQVDPDIVVMDVLMPRMSGLQATAAIMSICPRPILLVSSSQQQLQDGRMFEAIALGALDIVEKPVLDGPAAAAAKSAFIAKVKTLSTVRTAHRLLHAIQAARRQHTAPPPRTAAAGGQEELASTLVVLAASTGGPSALASVLASLPRDLQASVLAVQHIAPGFDQSFTSWISRECDMEARVAVSGTRLVHGQIWVAPSDRHLLVTEDRRLQLEDGPAVDFQKPSANLLFSSAAAAFGAATVAVVLSGMGADGTRGMKDVREAGGHTIAQDEATSTVFGMPKAAIDAGVVDRVLPVDRIGRATAERCAALARGRGGAR